MTQRHAPDVKPVTYGVVPAAGLGTRFLPITRTVPKELLPIVDTAVIELVVRELSASGIERVVLVVAPGKEMIAQYFEPQPKIAARLGAELRTHELELLRRPGGPGADAHGGPAEPKGNGHAVLQARTLVGDQPFAMLWGDDLMQAREPVIAQLLKARERLGGGSVVGCVRVNKKESLRYGMVAGSEVDAKTTRVLRIVEKPAPGGFAQRPRGGPRLRPRAGDLRGPCVAQARTQRRAVAHRRDLRARSTRRLARLGGRGRGSAVRRR